MLHRYNVLMKIELGKIELGVRDEKMVRTPEMLAERLRQWNELAQNSRSCLRSTSQSRAQI
jgi:hypothetical protein